MAIFRLRGCVSSLRTTWDQRGSLIAHLFQKDPKSVKKWPSYGYFSTERLRDSIENHMRQKGILRRSSYSTKKILDWSRNGWVMAIFPLRGCVIQLRTILDNGQQGPFGAHLYRKGTLWCSFLIKLIQNSSRNGWLMAISPLRVCMIPLQTTWDKREPFDVHLCQKDPKSAKKRLIYGYFPTETLCDSIENHRGQKGILWCSFVPKRSIIRQEKAELWLLHSVNITTVPVTTLQ